MGAEGGLRRRVKGLSEAEFRRAPGRRSSAGRRCSSCAGAGAGPARAAGMESYAELKGRMVYQCNRCKRQVGLTAGTVFHWTKLPLTAWFLAIYHLSQSKGGMGCRSAGAPAGHAAADRLADQAQADGGDGGARGGEAQAGGPGGNGRRLSRRAALGGKRGRGAAGKTPFVAAVETTAERKPRRLKLTVVKGFRKKEVEALARRDLAAGSNVVTDGLSCWTAVEQAGCSHVAMLTGSGPQAARWAPFHMENLCQLIRVEPGKLF